MLLTDDLGLKLDLRRLFATAVHLHFFVYFHHSRPLGCIEYIGGDIDICLISLSAQLEWLSSSFILRLLSRIIV